MTAWINGETGSRIANDGDIESIAALVANTFADDPCWGPALDASSDDRHGLAAFWRPYVETAVPYGMVDVVDADDGSIASTALWIPPGEPELTPDGEQVMLGVARGRLSVQGFADLEELFERFEAVHPQQEPHAYLSILATDPAHRGHGYAQRMVAERLKKLDREGIPAYLESSNPGNDRRYERLGFHELVRFNTVINPISIGIFWHDPSGRTGPGKA